MLNGKLRVSFLTIVMAALFSFNILQTPAPDLAGKTAVVTGTTVNLRAGPGTDYGKIATLDKGTKLGVLAQSNGWYKLLLPNGTIGWAVGSYLSVSDSTNTDSGPAPVEPEPDDVPSGTYLIIKESIVNVRSGAGTAYAVVAKVTSGEKLAVIKRSGDWYLVSLPDGKQGWVAGWLADIRNIGLPSRGDTTPPVGNDQDNPPQPQDPVPAEPEPEKPDSDQQPPDSEIPDSVNKLTGLEFMTGDDGEELLEVKSSGEIKYEVSRLRSPDRIVIDLQNSDINGLQDINAEGNFVQRARVAQFSLTPMTVRIVIDLAGSAAFKALPGEDGSSVTFKLSEPSIKGKVIVIDAGHGGYDPGAIGVTGLQEKDYNLQTALLLQEKVTALGATALLTRGEDTFISLTGRATAANEANADVFVSIHANSSENSSIRGTSTYYYAPASEASLYAQLAERQNLASSVQDKITALTGTRDIGIRQANFAVLRNTAMPSILVESAFLSNSEDEALLKDPQFRENVAQGIADGLVDYFSS